jgi:hypothetical protein
MSLMGASAIHDPGGYGHSALVMVPASQRA